MSPIEHRVVFMVPGDVRPGFEQAIVSCKQEHGGRLIGKPTVSFDGKYTEIAVDEGEWWRDYMRVHWKDLSVTS